MGRPSSSLVAAMLAAFALSGASVGSTPRPFTLHFPAGVDVSTVQGVPAVSRQGHDIVIDTAIDGKERERRKLLLFVPGYRFVTMDIDLTRDVHEVEVPLTPLAPIHVTGHVLPSANADLNGGTVRCTMFATWGMEFFGYIDGMAPSFELGSQVLKASDQYRFAFDLPDAARDPRAADETEFVFAAYTPAGSLVRLQHSSDDPTGMVRAMQFYPPDLLLSPVRRE